jgi:hypothetical protein
VKRASGGLVVAVVLAAGCGGGGGPQRTGAGAGLAGVWTHTVGRAQLLATHSPDYLDARNLQLDVGRYRLVLLRGHVTLSKRNPISTFHASGTFTVHGHTIAFRFTNAFEHDAGSRPDRSCCDPPWHMRWSLYRQELTLRQLPGSSFEIPPALWATAWRHPGA